MNREMEQNPEPRIGIAPFPAGVEKPKTVGAFRVITSKTFQLGDLGECYVELQRPLIRKQKDEVSKGDQAFTIYPSGDIKTGRLGSFLRRGYYAVAVCVTPYNTPIDESDQRINVGIWINGTGPIVKADLRTSIDRDEAYFFGVTDNGAIKEFVLPNDQEILREIRINVSSN